MSVVDASQRMRLELPAGFEWVEWDAAIRCIECRLVFTAMAHNLETEQRLYDEMAAEHRPRCPGDGA